METFSALWAICAGNSSVTGKFPAQRPVTRSFDVFFDLRLNNGWVNNREAADLRRHRDHYVATVMFMIFYFQLMHPVKFLDYDSMILSPVPYTWVTPCGDIDLDQYWLRWLTAPSHYLSQCAYIMKSIPWHSPERNSIGILQHYNPESEFECYTFEITATSPRVQYVKQEKVTTFQ